MQRPSQQPGTHCILITVALWFYSKGTGLDGSVHEIQLCVSLSNSFFLKLGPGRKTCWNPSQVHFIRNQWFWNFFCSEQTKMGANVFQITLHPALPSIINALIFSRICYCPTLWSGAYKKNIHSEAATCSELCCTDCYQHQGVWPYPVLKELKWLPVTEALLYRDIVMAYKCVNCLVPGCLSDMLTKHSDVHNHATRHCSDLQIPKCRTTLVQYLFAYRATKVWNFLSPRQDAQPLNMFKKIPQERLMETWCKM